MMDINEEEVLISLRNMRNSDEESEFRQNNNVLENGHASPVFRHAPSNYHPNYIKPSLQWLDLRVFYIKLSKCVVDNVSITPEFLTLNHIPLNRDTLLEVNCVRNSIYSDSVSTLLKRDRLDKRSEEVTFVSTDSIRTTGSVKFEVFHKDMLVLHGALELCHCSNYGYNQGPRWSMNCESDVFTDSGYLKGNQNHHHHQSPAIEVYVAGSFSGSPIVLTKSLQLSYCKNKKQMRKGMLERIPEYDEEAAATTTTQGRKDHSSTVTIPSRDYSEYKQQEEGGHLSPYLGVEYREGEDGELTWFNAGVRVGVGIGLSISLGVGIGVGLLVRTYQGTTRNFTRRLL